MTPPNPINQNDLGDSSLKVVDTAELSIWFKSRPKWLQDAARRLLQNGVVTSNDIDELSVLCKKEAGVSIEHCSELVAKPIPNDAFFIVDPTLSLRLDSISEIQGINALAPRKPLAFGVESLTIVYGANGSGKSGYMRALKHVCGGRGIRDLHGNVFEPSGITKDFKITYTSGTDRKTLIWTPAVGAHSDLHGVSLYDTDSAHVYVNNENEVAYEPVLLGHFRILVDVCEKVEKNIGVEVTAKKSAKPALPAEYTATTHGSWFNKLSRLTPDAEIAARCVWSEALEAEHSALKQRIAETNPADKARALRKTISHLASLTSSLKTIETQLREEAFPLLLAAKATAKAKRFAANVDAKKVFDGAPLDGVASESWRLLWEQARAYSEGEAYRNAPFPNAADDARCVLCQQSLDEAAKARLNSFEAFIKGSLEAEAVKAENALADMVAEKQVVMSGTDLDTKLDLAGLDDEEIRNSTRSYCEALSERRASFMMGTNSVELVPLPSASVVNQLTVLSVLFESKAKAFEDDAKTDTKPELLKKVVELSAQKWLYEQKPSIIAEVVWLKEIYLLSAAQNLANTKALTDKKSSLSETLITSAFLKRFEKELKALGASGLRVKIEKTKASKGQVWHQLKLKDNKQPAKTAEILSEGEFRIVSIAAFLADVATSGTSTPLIFDDPISSLDQSFEELTATRLVMLCKTHQVIVFTHRLSLLSMLEDAANKAAVTSQVVSLQKEPWGAGEPDEPPLPAQKPKAALNTLINQRLPKARNVWQAQGSAAYQVEAKALCSDTRITIERLIEWDLLADVVQRFRRPINTQGKLEKLAKIKVSDCVFLDDMMTKFSRYEHSQPGEAPVPLPEPDELAEDIQKLKVWQDEFANREVAIV